MTTARVRSVSLAAWAGLAVSVTLIVAAMTIPWAADWNVHVFSFPPLHAEWDPRVGPGTLPAIGLGAITILYADQAARRWPWRRLLVGSFVLSVGWLTSLATVDGRGGIGQILDTSYEYLRTARQVTSVSATLHEFVDRIPSGNPGVWPVHVAGHPPGALLFFVVLVSLGLGSGLAAGCVVLLVAATTPAAVLITVRRLGAEAAARRAAPFLAVGPAAIWMAVSADAMFGAFAAWGICALAMSATSRRRRTMACWGLLAGLLLGYCVMLSYGLPLLGFLAIAVLIVARSWRPLPWAMGAALAVVLAFAVAGFSWWEAYPLLRERYYSGVASNRPTSYWIWGNLAALSLSAGPLVGAVVAVVLRKLVPVREGLTRLRSGVDGPVVVLTTAAVAMVAAADLSAMSKGEVERVWIPFVPWLLLGTAVLPARWRSVGLAGQVVCALLLQHLLFTGW